jgi:tyrosyl-tRNA synthetase
MWDHVSMDLLADLEARGLIQDSTDRDALRARINAGPVGVYYGCDPSNDSLQIGNLIGLLVLRKFADAGHKAVALAGGATGMIGDPGGRSKERNLLDADTLAHNTKRIAEQLERISRTPLVNNLSWTGSLTLLDFLRDVGKYASVNQMIARESVKARLPVPVQEPRRRDPDRRLRPVGEPAGGRRPDQEGRRQARARPDLAAAAPL